MKFEISESIDIKLKNLKYYVFPGCILYIKNKDGIKIPFAVLGVCEDKTSCVIQQIGMVEERPFQEEEREDGKNMNEYEGSDIQKYIEGEWLDQFKNKFKNRIIGKPFLLEADDYDPEKTEYPYYKDRRNVTKYDKNGYAVWFWTSTPYVGLAIGVRYCTPSGNAGGNYYANHSSGVVPACRLRLE